MGQSNGSGTWSSTLDTQNALFLKVFSGEVLQTFETAAVMKPLHMIRTITSGRSAQFPVTGIASAQYHKPGTDIITENGHDNDSTAGDQSTGYATAFKHAEKVINVDDLLLATTFIDKLDEAKNHYDVRSIYSQELGRALAKQFDRNLIGLSALAAASYNTSTGVPTARAENLTGTGAGTVITNNQFNITNGTAGGNIPAAATDEMVAALYDMAAAFDVKNVPSEERYCVLTPTSYYRLVNSADGRQLLNRDFGTVTGSYVSADLPEIAGFKLIRSNNAAAVFGVDGRSSFTANSGQPFGANNTYTAHLGRVVATCFQKQAIGTVKLMDLAMESDYDIRLQGNLMVAKYAMGHGILRPECAGVICAEALPA
jgi:hypothetical protein